MGIRAGGLVALVSGLGLTAWTWHDARTQGAFSLALAILAPLLVVWGLALLAVPIEKLVVPQMIDGKPDYNLRQPKYTPLGWALAVLGVAAGGLFAAYLKYGL